MEDAKNELLEALRYRPSSERPEANIVLDNFRRGLQLLRPVAEKITRQRLEKFPLERTLREAPTQIHKEP